MHYGSKIKSNCPLSLGGSFTITANTGEWTHEIIHLFTLFYKDSNCQFHSTFSTPSESQMAPIELCTFCTCSRILLAATGTQQPLALT